MKLVFSILLGLALLIAQAIYLNHKVDNLSTYVNDLAGTMQGMEREIGGK